MKQRTGIFLWLIILLVNAQALPAKNCLPFRVGNPAGNYIIPGTKGQIIYRRINGAKLALDSYSQPAGNHRPAVIIIHGGNYNSGSRFAFTGQFQELLTKAGFNWFAVDYRLTNKADAADDIATAVQFIRCHAAKFRIDPRYILLLGEDVGAEIALNVATKNSNNIRSIISIGGKFSEPIPTPEIPTLFIHGTSDIEMPIAHIQAIAKSQYHHEFVPVEGGIHRAENWRPEQWGYKTKLREWMRYQVNLGHGVLHPLADVGRWKHGNIAPNHLEYIHYKSSKKSLSPAVIIFHGGGWEAGDKITYITPLFEPLARAGFTWFSFDYRLTPEVNHQAQIDDAFTAVNFIKTNAHRLKIDPNKIFILGESASGQMVSLLASDPTVKLAGVISMYGVYDFEAMAKDITPRSIPTRLFGITKLDDEARKTLRQYSPLHNVHREMPPMLLICGTNDGLFPQHQAYLQKLKEHYVAVESINVDGAPHGMENWEGHPNWMDYKKQITNWIKKNAEKKIVRLDKRKTENGTSGNNEKYGK